MYVCLPYSLLCQHCHQHQHPHLHQDLDDLHLGIDRLWAETALRLEDEGICGKNTGDHRILKSIFNNQNQQHCDWMMRVSEDQHYGCSHEHLFKQFSFLVRKIWGRPTKNNSRHKSKAPVGETGKWVPPRPLFNEHSLVGIFSENSTLAFLNSIKPSLVEIITRNWSVGLWISKSVGADLWI